MFIPLVNKPLKPDDHKPGFNKGVKYWLIDWLRFFYWAYQEVKQEQKEREKEIWA